jgi:ectoine hydroxylase-related dioxygenase (phytanoyl-CoA dioxygenase family)
MAAEPMFEEALRQCGVTEATLTAGEREALDRQGYFVLADLVGGEGLECLRAEFETAIDQGRQGAPASQTGTRHADHLASKSAAFDVAYTHPKVLAAVRHGLRGAVRVFQLSGRDPLPKYGQQGLHTDWLPRAPSEPFSIVTAIWLLDDFTPNNGATRLIPGSHLLPRPLPKSMQEPASRHPDQKFVVARAGSVLIFNGHLWHSGTRNDSAGPRRVLQCQFVALELLRTTGTSPEISERLVPAARYILGA